MTLTIFQSPHWNRHPLNPCPTSMWESEQTLSRTPQKKCHHSLNKVPANDDLSSFVSMHLHRGATGSRHYYWVFFFFPCGGHCLSSLPPPPAGPWWPLALMTDWTFCPAVPCPGEDKRGWQWQETQSPWRLGEDPTGVTGQAGQLSDGCSCGHVHLLLHPLDPPAMSADVAFVSW